MNDGHQTRTAPADDRSGSEDCSAGWLELFRHTKSSRVIQLPSIYVGIEPGRYHGWDIVARRFGRIVLHDRCVAVLSVAECEAAELAQFRGWRLAR